MSTDKRPKPARSQNNTKNNGVPAELNEGAIANLAGYLDVLVQMDLAQKQRNERKKDVTALQNSTKNTTQAD